MNRRKMLLSTLGSTLAVNGVSIAAASTPPLFQRESLPQEFSKVISSGKLRILVLSGSPHKDGTTNLLATNFVKGAKEAGLKSAVLIRLLRILMLAEAVFSVSKTQANVLSVMMFLQYCTL